MGSVNFIGVKCLFFVRIIFLEKRIVGERMSNEELFNQIKRCEGEQGCFGFKDKNPRPVVLPNYGKPSAMIITEQPGKKLVDDIDENREKIQEKLGKCFPIPPNKEKIKNADRDMWSELCWARFACQEIKAKVPEKLRKFFGEEFQLSLEEKKGKFYWTHYIKCPGWIRENSRVDKDACANKYLRLEILTLKPELIIAFGALPSQWLLKKSGKKEDWRDFFFSELGKVWELKNRNELGIKEKLETLKDISIEISLTDASGKVQHTARACFFYHPSGRNPAAYLTEKIFEILSP